MFYSRPKVDALGWDLTELPLRNGCKHFDAFTSDNRPVDFRFSGGWLSVESGPAGAPLESPDMKEVLAIPIAPFGIMDIEPEQICDILGLTVNGQKIGSAGMRTGAWGFDWSGVTTYWESTHLMQPADDARMFMQKLCDAFRGLILVQAEWGSHGQVRCRQVNFLMASDANVSLCIDPKGPAQALLAGVKIAWEDFDNAFAYRVDFSRDDRTGDDVTGGIKYSTIQHRRYCLRTQFPTEDAEAQARTKTLLSVIEASFCRGLQLVNLQTGAVMTKNLRDDQDKRSYSIALRDEWLEKKDRYLFVGMTVRDDEFGGEGGVLYGARPVAD